MIIGIDGNEANVEKKVGISEYAFELLWQFSEFRNQKSLASTNEAERVEFRIYLKEKPRDDLPKEINNWKYRIAHPRKLWTQFALPIDLYFHKPRPDIFFSPTHYAPRFSPIPTAISIMDLSYIHYPQMFKKSDLYQLKNWTLYSVKNAKKVFTISNASKDDIIKIYNQPEGKVVVTYPGIKSKMQKSELQKEKFQREGKYILFVGTLQPRKNIVRLIEAFSKIDKKDLSLVIAGKKGWLYEEILNAPKELGIENRVKFLEFVSKEELEVLYQNALCLVLPSLYEGFGLPVLEAMKNGCPVIISNVSSLPEAGGDAALYVNPEDVNDIASKIRELINNEKLRKELIEKGYKQVKKFSWEKTAKETLKALEEIVKKKN